MSPSSFNRRQILASSGMLAALAAAHPLSAKAQGLSSLSSRGLSSTQSSETNPTPASPADSPLAFDSDGTFRVVQFNDTQDDHLTDRRTIEFMGQVLDKEKADFALINGDVISSGPKNATQVYQAINNVVLPMEERGIPWAVTFGNHDEDSAKEDGTGVLKPQMTEFVRQYKHNVNPADDAMYGVSNGRLEIAGSKSATPAFALWLLDSGAYAPESPAGQSTDGLKAYDWLRPEQVQWYLETSAADESRYGAKTPGLMFFHIPTFEHHHMWYGQQYTSKDSGHAEAVKRHNIVGEKNEDCYTGLFNSGIYSAVFQRGDVLGIYCGHDHINTYMGNYYGVELGYGPGTGFGPYGLHDGTWDQHTLRGARVFTLDESAPRHYAGTHTVFAKDYGIDMNPVKQPLEAPAAFPEYVTEI
ncbi:metallophosphoesterase family protein [Corynebacterium tapiri]|uniref:Phosphoesterase n=1 Tax=Corynebacterium tapiri TaxID=1448266 RepID=A0A5C4U6Z6_9CORY|nr:metallophosphoesterase family protein [Corynebacterium tapiri]TNL99747.1 phosphoesterase [Corynebacterium tapiri]